MNLSAVFRFIGSNDNDHLVRDWVRVGSVFPDLLEDVLVVVCGEDGTRYIDMGFWNGQFWCNSGMSSERIRPQAWMRLPELPDLF